MTCHADHDTVSIGKKKNFRCDCGTDKYPNVPCLLRAGKEPNDRNVYTHNFELLYCFCNQPVRPYVVYKHGTYVMRQDNGELMILCIECLEWFHHTCLEIPNQVRHRHISHRESDTRRTGGHHRGPGLYLHLVHHGTLSVPHSVPHRQPRLALRRRPSAQRGAWLWRDGRALHAARVARVARAPPRTRTPRICGRVRHSAGLGAARCYKWHGSAQYATAACACSRHGAAPRGACSTTV